MDSNGLYDPPFFLRWTQVDSFGLIFECAGYNKGYNGCFDYWRWITSCLHKGLRKLVPLAPIGTHVDNQRFSGLVNVDPNGPKWTQFPSSGVTIGGDNLCLGSRKPDLNSSMKLSQLIGVGGIRAGRGDCHDSRWAPDAEACPTQFVL